MKAILYTIFTMLSIFAISSCGEDANGGGSACTNVECNKDGGVCVDGTCHCLNGWTGPDCSQRDVPSGIRIKRIEVDSFPRVRTNRVAWDKDLGAPDIFLAVKDSANIDGGDRTIGLDFKSTVKDDCQLGQIYSYTGLTWHLPNVEKTYTIGMFDYDEGEDAEFMGGYIITPVHHIGGMPKAIYAHSPNGNSRMKLYIEWVE